jgi:transcriptional regulator with XRE-family HTH domain
MLMYAPRMKRKDVIALLKKEQGPRSLRQFAVVLGVSAAYLSDVYRGNRDPGGKLLNRFGIEKVKVCTVSYRKASSDD